MKWQPIETAPKDGCLYLGCTEKGTIQIIKRNKHLHIWIDAEGREAYRTMAYWMPLPATPSNAVMSGEVAERSGGVESRNAVGYAIG